MNPYLIYLLGFFNSPTCNILIRTINPSANNPANYIKKIPYIIPDDMAFEIITNNVIEIINSIKLNGTFDLKLEIANNNYFKELYNI
jgi:adenine-specific DNA-methyltransferase